MLQSGCLIGGGGLLQGVKVFIQHKSTITPALGSITATRHTNTLYAELVVFEYSTVLDILTASSETKVRQSIIARITVNVIYLTIRPDTVDVEPNKTMTRIGLTIIVYHSIIVCSKMAC